MLIIVETTNPDRINPAVGTRSKLPASYIFETKQQGNGAASARVLAANGAKVFGCDLNLAAAQHTQRRVDAEGGDCTVVSADVDKDADVKFLMEACVARYGGRIDTLINNVGRSEPGGPAKMSEEAWDSQMDVNLKSVLLSYHYVLPIMKSQEGGGAIVNVSSIAGMRYIGKPQVAYSATKAAAIQFTKVTAVIYAKRGARLNVVVPRLIHTPLVGLLADKYVWGWDLEGFVERRHKAVPMGGMGDSFDVAYSVAFWLLNRRSISLDRRSLWIGELLHPLVS
ncbi:2,5-dichloro-2,5-cyclohexadiene-1,4-diol dehydrogenase [Paracoccidioides lutzii Pb01]|uniref:2,5-dichloro-2,5-cyclohexadiene-1,4-diol dehydrogenase n=1 Tax=Paracoccidioides lutzii (strain ATCC MYA-826 / Pb01) TaxID=502779 RepID=C1H9Z2_PARBA|nr:2,5-dichloro-2,5-cyclohexadiene-1,4-diol dehydrogenase [Paracoccidioides lutzii Pb01]EEH37165.2 2,5-dichloro-2,5-cyclohexadiene-1,4-diol dehydrogenase [Paracoccidioides lutzii Pb01]